MFDAGLRLYVATVQLDQRGGPLYLGAPLTIAPSPYVPLAGDRVLIALCRPR